jgi:hypothetical protein
LHGTDYADAFGQPVGCATKSWVNGLGAKPATRINAVKLKCAAYAVPAPVSFVEDGQSETLGNPGIAGVKQPVSSCPPDTIANGLTVSPGPLSVAPRAVQLVCASVSVAGVSVILTAAGNAPMFGQPGSGLAPTLTYPTGFAMTNLFTTRPLEPVVTDAETYGLV